MILRSCSRRLSTIDTLKKKLIQLGKELECADITSLSAAVGFDGFVDEIIEVVDRRESFDSYSRMTTIEQFGERISKAAGLSTNLEFVPTAVKLGGNGPIMANALVCAGANVSYIGSLGIPNIHPVFLELVERCTQAFSIAEPGHTDALEFNDGKVMLGKLESLNDVNWQSMIDVIGEDRIRTIFAEADLVATVNWTMTPYMNEIWENLLKILPKAEGDKKPIFFVDLADPEKRKPEDIREALELIQKFNPYYRVVLGLNRKEASEIAAVLGLALTDAPEDVELEEIVTALGDALDLWCLMVHPTHEAGAVSNGRYAHTVGPFTSRPRLTTGAGDNFNSGFCLGLLLELSLEQSLMLGKATSGFYVRNMYSPSFEELKAFVNLWAQRAGEDF